MSTRSLVVPDKYPAPPPQRHDQASLCKASPLSRTPASRVSHITVVSVSCQIMPGDGSKITPPPWQLPSSGSRSSCGIATSELATLPAGSSVNQKWDGGELGLPLTLPTTGATCSRACQPAYHCQQLILDALCDIAGGIASVGLTILGSQILGPKKYLNHFVI